MKKDLLGSMYNSENTSGTRGRARSSKQTFNRIAAHTLALFEGQLKDEFNPDLLFSNISWTPMPMLHGTCEELVQFMLT